MANKNKYNQHNANIKNQGGVNSWGAEITDELYENMDAIESDSSQKQNQINGHETRLQNQLASINQVVQNDLPAKQNQINDHETRLQNQLASINQVVQNDLPAKQNQINEILNTQFPEVSNRILEVENISKVVNDKMITYDNRIKDFTTESLKNLSTSFLKFADGEVPESSDEKIMNKKVGGLKQDRDSWLNYIYWTFGFIILGDVIITIIAGLATSPLKVYPWYGLNIFAFTILYFFVSQYSYYKNLYLDYKNREVVAESYFGILINASGENEKAIITKIVAETLFSRQNIKSGSDLPVKEAIRIIEKTADAVGRKG